MVAEPIWNLPRVEVREIATVKESRPCAVITGHKAWDAVGSLLSLPIVVQAEPQNADLDTLNMLANELPEHVEVIYGIGGGLTSDVAKYIGFKRGLPVVLIPTALSVDGFFTALVAARQNGSVQYVTTGPAELVVIDFDVIAHAPAHLRGTGIVEILSMTTGLLDWKFSAERNKNTQEERFQPWAASIAAGIAQQAYKIAQGVGEGRTDALRNLLDLICMEVQLTNQLGHNRPQEGSEQYFAYALEPMLAQDKSIPYADLVGPGIVVAAALHKQNVAPIKDTLQSAGVRFDQIPRLSAVKALKMFPQYAIQHNLPYSILHEFDPSEANIQDIIGKVGLA